MESLILSTVSALSLHHQSFNNDLVWLVLVAHVKTINPWRTRCDFFILVKICQLLSGIIIVYKLQLDNLNLDCILGRAKFPIINFDVKGELYVDDYLWNVATALFVVCWFFMIICFLQINLESIFMPEAILIHEIKLNLNTAFPDERFI